MNEEATMGLAGSAWTLISFETGTGVIAAAQEAPATLVFSAAGEQDSRLSGSGGCNRYTGSYTLTGDRFHPGLLASTSSDDQHYAPVSGQASVLSGNV